MDLGITVPNDFGSEQYGSRVGWGIFRRDICELEPRRSGELSPVISGNQVASSHREQP